ncbi:MAG: peptidoglycan-binding protein, partial [Gammaproteobacteria bacterium]|nr:peptidoglycan-binding protein [Gammaproteobacteria bacterium]
MSIRLLAITCLLGAWPALAAEPDASDFCGGPELRVDAAFPVSDAQCAKLSALHAAREHGLDPADYRLQEIEALAAHSLNARHERLDELLDEAYRKFASDVSLGRVDPELADPDWHIPSRRGGPDDESKPLDEAIAASPFPPHPAYARLRTAMTAYLAIQSAGGWPILPDGPALSVGMRDEAVEIARNRLRITGDFDADVEADAWFFGAGLDAAVRAFQARQGLKVDGVVGGDTREAMNVPVEARIEQLAIALERWRWVPRELGTDYAWVNVAELRLRVVGDGEPRLTSRVIVGHSSRPTPSLQGEIRQLVFNPSWSLPTTIATEDLLPKIQRDPEFLARGGYRVYTG